MEFRTHSISWNITRRCNLNCAHCYLDADFRTGWRTDELGTQECFGVIDQLGAVNPHALLILTGGEPLLRKDIHDIAQYATERGFFVVVGTNGTLVNENVVKRLMDRGVKGASISIYSIRPEMHDRFTRVPGSWQGAIRGAEVLRRNNLGFIIQTSVMSWNHEEIPEIIDLAYRLGAKVTNVYFLVCTGRGQGLTDLAAAEYEKMLSHLYQLQDRYQGKMLIGAKCAPQYKRIVYDENPTSPFLHTYPGGCPAATYYCQVTPTGDVAPCPYMPITVGNVRKQSFSEIWRDAPVMRQLRNRALLQGRCGSCEFQELCGGCRARAYVQTGNYLAQDPSCQYQPGMHGGRAVVLQKESSFGLEPEFHSVWTEEARKRLEKIPSFARGMVIKSVERFAEEKGYPAVTPEVMKEARERLWGAFSATPPLSNRNLEKPGDKQARLKEDAEEEAALQVHEEILWTEEALKRVENAPEFVRPGIRKLMLLRAKERGYKTITSEFLTEIRNESMLRVAKVIKKFGFEELRMQAFEVAKKKMRRNARKIEVIEQIEDFLGKRTSKNQEIIEKFNRYLEIVPEVGIPWTEEALGRLELVPDFIRPMLKKAVEEEGKKRKQVVISVHFLGQALKELLPKALGSMGARVGGEGPPKPDELKLTLPWDSEPLARARRMPIPLIRQQVISRVESYALAQNANRVTIDLFTKARFLDFG